MQGEKKSFSSGLKRRRGKKGVISYPSILLFPLLREGGKRKGEGRE